MLIGAMKWRAFRRPCHQFTNHHWQQLNHVMPDHALIVTNIGCLPHPPTHSGVCHVPPGLVHGAPSDLGRMVVLVVILLLLMSGDIEINPGPLTLADLRTLLTDLESIRAKWYNFGLQLKVDVGILEGIKVQYSDPLDCLREALKHWLKTSPNCTWKCIVDALSSPIVGDNALARDLERKQCLQLDTHVPLAQTSHTQEQVLNPEASTSTIPEGPPPAKRPCYSCVGSSPTPAMTKYAHYLRAFYSRSFLPENNKFPPTPSKHYINLAYIARRTTSKHESEEFKEAMVRGEIDKIARDNGLDFSNVAERLTDGSYPQVVLVEGAPGVGKTTFAWEFCRKWGRGESKQEYSLVILLRLRDKRIQEAKCLGDLFYHPDETLPDVIAAELINSFGEGVLILLEGLDELPKHQRTESSVFLDLIHGRLLPLATVLITTRPWASEYLHKNCKEKISQHVEILGFKKQQIQNYLQSVCTPDDDTSLLSDIEKYLSCYPQIHAAMYIPLNAAIVVEVYRRSRTGECIIPKTMTQLYTALSHTLLIRHLEEHPVHRKTKWRIHHFDDLPSDVYKHFLQLSKLAYDSIRNNQKLVFSSEDLPDNLDTLGFMQSVPELYVNESFSHNFLHLTVQEYLAAVHITQLLSEEHLKHFDERGDNLFKVVLKFVAGLTKFSEIPSDSIRALFAKPEYNEDDPITQYCVKCDYTVNSDHVNWLFETQDPETINAILGSGKSIEFDSEVLMHFDCYCLGYCIAHSHCLWKLVLQDIEDEGVRMLSAGGNALPISKQNSSIVSIELIIDTEPYSLSDGILEYLFAQLSLHFRVDLQELIGSRWGADFLSLIRTLRLLRFLKVLEWTKYTASEEDLRELCDLLASTSNSLEIIKIENDFPEGPYVTTEGMYQHTSLSVDVQIFSGVTSTISVLTSLGFHFTAIRIHEQLRFREIRDLVYHLAGTYGTTTLSNHSTIVKDAMATAKLTNNSSSLEEVDVRDDNIDSHPQMRLPPSLKVFEWTDYFKCMISVEELRELCDLLASTSNSLEIVKIRTLSDVDLTAGSYMNVEGTYQHTSVSLHVKINEDDVASTVSVPTNLGLDLTLIGFHELFATVQACQLAEALHNTTTLKALELHVVNDSNGTLVAISKIIQNNKSLEKLNVRLWAPDVSHCGIESEGMHHIAQALQESTTLRELKLNWSCSVDSEGGYVCHLAQALCKSTTLEELDLSHNSIGTEDAMALAKLIHSKSLQQVKISSCGIDSEVLCHLTQAVCENITLRKLDLSHNPIGTKGAMTLTELMHSKSLEDVNVSLCRIDGDVACQLAQALYENTTLKKLDLSHNPIGTKGATALAKLMRNTSLQELNMTFCKIDNEGACNLAQALHGNTTLRKLNLSYNPIAQGSVDLAEMLYTNTSLRALNLTGTLLSGEGIRKLLKAITVNRTVHLEVSHHECGDWADRITALAYYNDLNIALITTNSI